MYSVLAVLIISFEISLIHCYNVVLFVSYSIAVIMDFIFLQFMAAFIIFALFFIAIFQGEGVLM